MSRRHATPPSRFEHHQDCGRDPDGISDNGRSFHVGTVLLAKNPKRLGLIGMKERVEWWAAD